MLKLKNIKLVVIGLGYVGLPLAIEFSKKRKVLGFDINIDRIDKLNQNIDINNEFSVDQLSGLKNICFTSDLNNSDNNCYIITAPTPIDEFKKPNLYFLKNATEIVSRILKKNDIVIYESTVYPGCTEEVCVPILEKGSSLKYNQGFLLWL